jgi:hypothetical protein
MAGKRNGQNIAFRQHTDIPSRKHTQPASLPELRSQIARKLYGRHAQSAIQQRQLAAFEKMNLKSVASTKSSRAGA